MTFAIYFYSILNLYELRNELAITAYPYYYEDIMNINQELVGFYPLLF